MLVRLSLILLLAAAVLLAISCGDNPSDPQRNNSLDTENPATSGDPFQLSGAVGASGVSLAWQAVESPTPHEYRIKRRAGDTGTFSTIGTQEPPATEYQDDTVQAGSTYHYKIAAADEDGVESSISEQVAVTVHSLAAFSINNGDASTRHPRGHAQRPGAGLRLAVGVERSAGGQRVGAVAHENECRRCPGMDTRRGSGDEERPRDAKLRVGSGTDRERYDRPRAVCLRRIVDRRRREQTPTRSVELTLTATGATQMQLSNTSDFDGATWHRLRYDGVVGPGDR